MLMTFSYEVTPTTLSQVYLILSRMGNCDRKDK